uniref:Uncharacterized protein n=1 Tax=Glossina austeni TaxID=7395 RepID=A0A1A9VS10_GLOAU
MSCSRQTKRVQSSGLQKQVNFKLQFLKPLLHEYMQSINESETKLMYESLNDSTLMKGSTVTLKLLPVVVLILRLMGANCDV